MDAPKLIWLQRPNRDPENEWCGEVTWCDAKQNDDDTCYIKAGVKTVEVVEQLRAELAEVKRERDELKVTLGYEPKYKNAYIELSGKTGELEDQIAELRNTVQKTEAERDHYHREPSECESSAPTQI